MAKAPKMRRAICFDTSPTIWGVRGDASRGDEHMILKTRRYIEHLSINKFTIVIPCPVIAEYLVGATVTQIQEMEILTRGFEYPMLDLKSAALAAMLQRGGKVDQIHADFGTPKQAIRIDAFIVAIAIEAGAEQIITNNVNEFRMLAGTRIQVDPVPEVKLQGVMEFKQPS